MTITGKPVNASHKDNETSKAVTNNETDIQVTEPTKDGNIENPRRNMSGSILSGRLEEEIKDNFIHNLETKNTNEDEENMSGSTVTGRLEEGRRMDEGGGVGWRRIGSLESELKPKIIGIKQANSKKNISDKGTSTGKVRKLILGYKTLVVKDADLKLRNHETNFKISIETSYLSPEKRRKIDKGSISSPRHTGCLGRNPSTPSLSHSSSSGSRQSMLRKKSGVTTLTAVWTLTPPSRTYMREQDVHQANHQGS